jgi:hypothetical protein
VWLHQKCDIHVPNNLAFFKSVEETSYKRSTFIVFSLSILFNLFAFQKQNQKPSPRKRKGKFFRMKLRWSGREKIMRNKISDPMGMKKHYSIQTIVLFSKLNWYIYICSHGPADLRHSSPANLTKCLWSRFFCPFFLMFYSKICKLEGRVERRWEVVRVSWLYSMFSQHSHIFHRNEDIIRTFVNLLHSEA